MPGTVTVGCKLPNGLILRVFQMADSQEMSPLGVRDVKVARDTGKHIRINGNAAPKGRSPTDAAGNYIPIIGGYALTHGVDADLWDAWFAANKDTDMVRNGMIFAHAKTSEVEAAARGNEARKSGLEPMDTQGDVRMPKQRTRLSGGSIAPLETARPGA